MKDHSIATFALEIFVFIEYKTRTFSESKGYFRKYSDPGSTRIILERGTFMRGSR